MAKQKVCKECRIMVEGDVCPICKGNQFTDNWHGQINIIDPNKSLIAQKRGIKVKGRYAIKVR
ncbi:DNA-directed RNA polymerase subunit E'' [Candidatus Woesearchaeota archaeon]|nr:DNA-directed RNA polymerase subunit E'' [Candidatus Woesearchaeota archaeon]